MHTSPKRGGWGLAGFPPSCGGLGLRSWRAAAPILFTHLISDMERDMYGDPMYELEPMRDATKFLEPIEVQKITVPIGDADSKYYQQPRKIKEETKEDKDKKKKEGEEKVKKDDKKKNDDLVEANLKKRIKESADAREKEPQAQARASSSNTNSDPTTPSAKKPDPTTVAPREKTAPIVKPLTASTAPSGSAPLDASKPAPTAPPGKTEPPKYKIGDMVTFDYQVEGNNHLTSKGIGEILAIFDATDGSKKYSIRDNTSITKNIPVIPEANEGQTYEGESIEKSKYKNGVTGIALKPSAPTATIAANGTDFIKLDRIAGDNSLVFKQGDKYIKYIIEIENPTEKEAIEYLNNEDKAHEYTCATVVNGIPDTTVITNKNNQKLIEDWIKDKKTKEDEIINDLLEIIMEPCGITFNDYFKNNAKINDDKITSIILKTLAAINFLHSKQVCHNDITQANILIEDNPAAANIKIRIIDFGKSELTCNKKEKQNKDLYDLRIIFDNFKSKLQDASLLKDKLQTILTYIEANKNDLFGKFAINDDLTLKTTSEGGKKKYFSKKYRKTRKLLRSKYVNKKYRKTRKIKRSKYVNKKYRKTRKNTYKKRIAKKTRKVRHFKKRRMIGGFLPIDECNDIRKMDFDFSNVENIQKIIALLKIESKKHDQYSATHSEILRYNEYLYNNGERPLSSIHSKLTTAKSDEERKKLQDEKQSIKENITNYIKKYNNLMDLICDINDIDIGTEFGFGE